MILAGGRARRMDGRDKGLLPLAGRPLIGHVLERFAPQVDRVVINANRHADDYAALGHPVIADVIGDFAGPLAGLHAGLLTCATPLLATVPCDAPLLPSDLVQRLAGVLENGNASLVTAHAAGRVQPAFMLCRREILTDLERYLSGGGRKILDWLTAMGAHQVAFADADAFANINTPEELDRLRFRPD